MKLAILLVIAIAALISVVPVQSTLHEDFLDFEKLVPTEEVKAVVDDYVQTDPDVQAALAFLKTEKFKTEYTALFKLSVFTNVVDFLDDAGVQLVDFLNKFADKFELPQYTKPTPSTIDVSSEETTTQSPPEVDGVTAMVEDVLKLLPLEESRALYEEKLETSPEFNELVKKLKTKEFKKLVFFAKHSRKLQRHLRVLRKHNLDVSNLFKLVAAFFGFQ